MYGIDTVTYMKTMIKTHIKVNQFWRQLYYQLVWQASKIFHGFSSVFSLHPPEKGLNSRHRVSVTVPVDPSRSSAWPAGSEAHPTVKVVNLDLYTPPVAIPGGITGILVV